MKSLAIWHDGPQVDQKVQIDCHLNFWKLPKKHLIKNEFERFLDVGLKINDMPSFANIFIYIPSPVAPSEVYDLGKSICKRYFILFPYYFISKSIL